MAVLGFRIFTQLYNLINLQKMLKLYKLMPVQVKSFNGSFYAVITTFHITYVSYDKLFYKKENMRLLQTEYVRY